MRRQKEHNYITKIDKLVQDGVLPEAGLCNIAIFHDDWCSAYQGGLCDCDPDIRVMGASSKQMTN